VTRKGVVGEGLTGPTVPVTAVALPGDGVYIGVEVGSLPPLVTDGAIVGCEGGGAGRDVRTAVASGRSVGRFAGSDTVGAGEVAAVALTVGAAVGVIVGLTVAGAAIASWFMVASPTNPRQ
jgi:hypothetical protein